ncbi:methyltransferase-like protein [Camillea tinctor]|nr:methyltransferase-like protein [Camillea tinctor]
MASPEQLRKEYEEQADSYDNLASVPLGVIERELFNSALGTCPGATVLDLGGGTGLRARQAITAGAVSVDVVDISPEMLQVGQAIEAKLKREGVIRYLQGDVAKPLDNLPLLAGGYDIVMANWVLDHAHDVAELEGMWANISAQLKPGGRFVGVRSGDPYAPCVAEGTGKYGVQYKDWKKVPGGVHFRYQLHADPPLDIEASSMEISYSGSTELHEKYGLCDIENEPFESSEAIRKDPEFWQLFIDNPSFVVVKARKKAN